jgi:hypothetical protein
MTNAAAIHYSRKKKADGTERKTGKLGDLPSGARCCHVVEGMTVRSLECDSHREALLVRCMQCKGWSGSSCGIAMTACYDLIDLCNRYIPIG